MTRNIVLFDLPGVHDQLLPLSYTRPVADFLLGTCTLREKWEALLPGLYSYFTASYLSEKYPMAEAPDTLFIASHIVAEPALAEALAGLAADTALTADNADGRELLVAYRGSAGSFRELIGREGVEVNAVKYDGRVAEVRSLTDIFRMNPARIEADFELFTQGREGQPVHRSNVVIARPSRFSLKAGRWLKAWCSTPRTARST